MNTIFKFFYIKFLIFASLAFCAASYAQKKNKHPEEIGTYYSLKDALAAKPEEVYKLILSKQKYKYFPEEILVFVNLTQLDLSNNKITEVPDRIVELKKLTYLNLSKNKITQLPETIGNLSMLNSLKISQNKIQSLPSSFFRLKLLEILDLSSNPLLFDPLHFNVFAARLKYLDVRNTKLSTEDCRKLLEILPKVIIKCSKECGCGK